MNPSKEIKSLYKKIERWSPSEDWEVKVSINDFPTEVAAILLYREGEPWVRMGYALRELIIAIGKLFRVLEVASAVTGRDQTAQLLRLVANSHDVFTPLFKQSYEFSDTRNFVSRILFEFESEFHKGFLQGTEDRSVELENFELFTEYSDCKAIELFFTNFGGQYNSRFVNQFERYVESFGREMDLQISSDLARTIMYYRTSEWLFPWLELERNRSVSESYFPLFAMKSNKQDDSMYDDGRIFEEIVSESNLDGGDRQNLHQIIRRVTEAINATGYEDFADIVTDKEGHGGHDSLLGNAQPVNVIPGDGGGVCCSFSMVIMRGKGKTGRLSFGLVMRKLRSHLLMCSGVTKLVLLFHDDWDSSAMAESWFDLQWHAQQGVVFVPILVRSGKLTITPM